MDIGAELRGLTPLPFYGEPDRKIYLDVSRSFFMTRLCTCCIWASNASFILSLNLSPVVHKQVRLPDVFWGKTDVHYVVIFGFVPRQVDIVPLLEKRNYHRIVIKKKSIFCLFKCWKRNNAQMLVGLVRWHWWPVWVVSLWSQKVMEVNFGPFGNIVFFIAMGQQMETSISR